MEPNYTYTPSPAFINSLTFAYVETYSFQRGVSYEQQQKAYLQTYEQLKSQKLKGNDLTMDEEATFTQLDKLCSFTQYLIDNNNQFHYSSKKTNTFIATDPKVALLKTILNTEVKEVLPLLCAPMYRDAFVFYDTSKHIVAVLNVCLSCLYMETSMFNYIKADYKTYDLLKRLFIDIGHDVENPTYFFGEDIERKANKTKL